MSEVSLRRNVVWIVCEDGDRWYRAVCRFVPPLLGSEDRLRISRWGTEPTKAVMARIKTTN